MLICETPRLTIRHFDEGDATFIFELLNQPAFIKNIADKGVRSIQDAVDYLTTGPIKSYQQFGFGLNLLQLKSTEQPIGMCGILQRDCLDFPDLGYALLSEHTRQGYALEAARAVVQHANQILQLNRLQAVTKPDNSSSLKLLEKLGFNFLEMIQLQQNDVENKLLEIHF